MEGNNPGADILHQLEHFYIIAICTIEEGKQVYKVAIYMGKKVSGQS